MFLFKMIKCSLRLYLVLKKIEEKSQRKKIEKKNIKKIKSEGK